MQTLQIIANRKRAEALGRAAIRCLSLPELDTLLSPLIAAGAMRTHYERITGATEHRDQMGNLIALTVGGRHFCKTGALGDMADKLAAFMAVPAVVLTLPAPGQSSTERLFIQQVGRTMRPTQSLALHEQTVGRIKRQSPPVHAYLENPMTGQKIEGSDFTIGSGK